MTLCLFDGAGRETRIPLPDYDAGVWHGFVPGAGPGQAYGYRAAGPYDPARGLRCNPAKLLLDPYARAISGEVTFGPEVLGYAVGDPDAPSALDSAGHVPRSLVVDGTFGWTDGGPLRRRYSDTIIYEVHVKGFTMRHPGVPRRAARHLRRAGARGRRRLPGRPRRDRGRAAAGAPERAGGFLPQRGLTNYWGYNTIGYFAPHNGYSAAVRAGRPGGQVAEFKAMVNALHAAGIEVLLDVVFNHTAEADQTGPDALLPRPGQPRVLPARPRRPQPLHRHHRLRQLAQRRGHP